MNELISKLMKLKTPHKVAVTVVAVAGDRRRLLPVLLRRPERRHHRRRERSKVRLTEELTTYEKRKVEYLAYRNELKQLQEEQRELLRVLPKKDEIASFMSSIQEQAELSGLEVLTFAPDAEVPEELYVKIPVRMEVRGGFHAITKFFKNVSELRRIVTVENLDLLPEPAKDANAPTRLKAKFIAATYRYQNPARTEGGT